MIEFWNRIRGTRPKILPVPDCLPLLLALFGAAVSCIRVDKTLASEFIPDNQDVTMHTAVVEVPMYMHIIDSMPTSGSGYLIVGSVNNPVYGRTTSSGALQILPVGKADCGDNPVVKSCYLSIRLGRKAVFSPEQAFIPQNIYVHKMLADLDKLKCYSCSLGPGDYEAVPLSKKGSIYTGGDTLTVYLDPAYGLDLLNSTREERDSMDCFTARYKGLYFTTDEQGEKGRLNYFNISDFSLYVKYTVDGCDSLRVFYANERGPNLNVCTHGSRRLETAGPAETLYFEGMDGLKPYIDMSGLVGNIRAEAERNGVDPRRIIISRAEMTLAFEPPADGDYSRLSHFPDSLYPCYKKVTDTTCGYYPVDDLYYDTRAGAMNRTKYKYTFDIGAFVQKKLSCETLGKADDPCLIPLVKYQDIYGKTSFAIDNYRYSLGDFYGNLSKSPPSLRITYTVLK